MFGGAATGSLTYAYRNHDDKVIGFPIDFSLGPIKDIHKKSGINHYFNWLHTTYHPMWNSFQNDQSIYTESLQELLEIDNGEHVTIWTCENASEQTGLRICCSILKGKNLNLSYINTYQAMHDFTKNKDIKIDIRQTGECNSEQLKYFYDHYKKPLTDKLKGEYAEEGEKLLNSQGIVRSWQKGKIIDDKQTRDDPFILECVRRLQREDEFIQAVKVIGEVIGHTEQPLFDAWIEYRIRSLIHSGQLDYEGSLQSMRMYHIKVS